jgi:hypothetical protein
MNRKWPPFLAAVTIAGHSTIPAGAALRVAQHLALPVLDLVAEAAIWTSVAASSTLATAGRE